MVMYFQRLCLLYLKCSAACTIFPFTAVGVNLFYFCIIIYLYGDLAIYAAAVPVSLMQVTW